MLVEPCHCEFKRAPRIETGCARIAIDQPFRLHCRIVQGVPFSLQKGEVAHAIDSLHNYLFLFIFFIYLA
jgi:hypothetical protein